MVNVYVLINSDDLVSKTELMPVIDSRKSFYKKATVFEMCNGDKYLSSYDTVVASIIDGVAKIDGTYSMTTLRHIKDFLYQNGFEIGTKKFLVETY